MRGGEGQVNANSETKGGEMNEYQFQAREKESELTSLLQDAVSGEHTVRQKLGPHPAGDGDHVRQCGTRIWPH